MNKKFKLTDKVTKESIRSPEFKRWLKVVLAAVCIFSLIFQLSTCAFQGLKVSAARPGDTVEIDLVPSLPSTAIIDMDAVFVSNGTTYYGIEINQSAIIYYTATGLPVSVYNGLLWSNDTYRIISIIEMSPFAFTWITDNSSVLDSSYITLVAGTYRFNDIMHNDIALDFSINFNFYADGDYFEGVRIVVSPSNVEFYSSDSGIDAYTPPYGWDHIFSDAQTVYLDHDQIVDNIGGIWFIANTNYNEVNSPSSPDGIDFTNEIRQFNDELTLYVTDSAEWSESFSFEFEVMGFGYSDTLYLQRGGANVYSMSYNFDIDGVFTPWAVYRYGYSTQSGGFLYQNARIIRFITNPDDTDFLQWLLDNTTLVATVDDAPAFDQIYETGFDVGYGAGYEQGFANSLIGDSLSGPINALSSITLIQIGDVEITLGGVVMTAIALCLVLAFLKLYAGG